MGLAIRGLTWTRHGDSALDIQQSDLGIYLQIMAGLDEVPEVRGQDVTVPGLAGRLMTNRVLDRLVLELAGNVMGVGSSESAIASDYRETVQAIQRAFDPTNYGVLVITLESGRTRTITARPLNIIWGDETARYMRPLSVALEQVTDLAAVEGS